jgi:hypothetical protein
MKNALKIVGIIALAAAIGFAFVSCDENSGGNDGSLNGTWKKGDYTIVITGNNYTYLEYDENVGKGTVVYSGNTITLTRTHYWDTNKWVSASGVTSGHYSVSGSTAVFSGFSDPSWDGPWTK